MKRPAIKPKAKREAKSGASCAVTSFTIGASTASDYRRSPAMVAAAERRDLERRAPLDTITSRKLAAARRELSKLREHAQLYAARGYHGWDVALGHVDAALDALRKIGKT